MRLARHGRPGHEKPIGSGSDGVWRDLSSLTNDIDAALLSTGLGEVRLALVNGALPVVELPIKRFGPPLASIGKIICIGLNYVDHARETGAELPAEPVMFLKTPDTVVGANDEVDRKSVV